MRSPSTSTYFGDQGKSGKSKKRSSGVRRTAPSGQVVRTPANLPNAEGEKVGVDLVFRRTGFKPVPMSVNNRHRRPSATEIAELKCIEVVVFRPPVNAASANLHGLFYRDGKLRTNIQFLLPKQRIGAQVRQLFG
jgi:hypothetical protein